MCWSGQEAHGWLSRTRSHVRSRRISPDRAPVSQSSSRIARTAGESPSSQHGPKVRLGNCYLLGGFFRDRPPTPQGVHGLQFVPHRDPAVGGFRFRGAEPAAVDAATSDGDDRQSRCLVEAERGNANLGTRERPCGTSTKAVPVITENSPSEAARLLAEPVSVFPALGDDFHK